MLDVVIAFLFIDSFIDAGMEWSRESFNYKCTRQSFENGQSPGWVAMEHVYSRPHCATYLAQLTG